MNSRTRRILQNAKDPSKINLMNTYFEKMERTENWVSNNFAVNDDRHLKPDTMKLTSKLTNIQDSMNTKHSLILPKSSAIKTQFATKEKQSIELLKSFDFTVKDEYSVKSNLAAIDDITKVDTQANVEKNNLFNKDEISLREKNCNALHETCDCTHISDTTEETFKDPYTFTDEDSSGCHTINHLVNQVEFKSKIDFCNDVPCKRDENIQLTNLCTNKNLSENDAEILYPDFQESTKLEFNMKQQYEIYSGTTEVLSNRFDVDVNDKEYDHKNYDQDITGEELRNTTGNETNILITDQTENIWDNCRIREDSSGCHTINLVNQVEFKSKIDFCNDVPCKRDENIQLTNLCTNMNLSENDAEILHPNFQESTKLEFNMKQQYEIYSGTTEVLSNRLDVDVSDKEYDHKNYDPDITGEELRNTTGNETNILITEQTENIWDNCRIREKNTKKEMRCKFCDKDIFTKNFARHLELNHRDENEIKRILEYPKNSKERRLAFSLFRNQTNFDLYIEGVIRPYRKTTENHNSDFYPCVYCKGLYKKEYLRRHSKVCRLQNKDKRKSGRIYYVTNSQTEVACAADPTNAISRLNVKEQVFSIMKADEVSLVAKKDLLISYFGESYLQKHKRERKEYSCSSRMRQLSRLLIAYRNISNNPKCCFKDILKPTNFDNLLTATRVITGYDPQKKTYKVPSLALHLGTYLKNMCDELIHLVLKQTVGFASKSKTELDLLLIETQRFKELLISRWNTEISSLANKDLQEKHWNKPLLVPLVSDIKIFRDETINMAEACCEKFREQSDDIETFKLLVQSTLSLVILFNRRRIGDVQYLKIEDYLRQNKSNINDFESVLTRSEIALTSKYRRIMNSGKGSRQVVILLPEMLDRFINIILEHRKKYFSQENQYVFALPQSKIKWGQGDVAIRLITSKIQLQHPEAISSNKLRKHIATVAQILNLTKEDITQFSKFMGHTEKTHAEFYELPVDIYQTAKVSKLLLLMEKGSLPVEFKGKSLSEIEFDKNLEYPEEDSTQRQKSSSKSTVSEPASSPIRSQTIPNRSQTSAYSDDDSDAEIEPIPLKKKKIQKKGWSKSEINLISKRFQSFINNKNYPSGQFILNFINETKIERTVPQIKSKLQHLMTTL